MTYKKYYTPEFAIEGLCNLVSITGSTILEPCVGKGAISNYLIKKGYNVITNDLDPRVESDYHFDATNSLWPIKADWIITNPPYGNNLESQIVLNSIKHSNIGCALLMLISYKEPTRFRAPIHKEHPPNIEIVTKRIRFSGSNKYTQTTSWFVWIHGMKEQKFMWLT